MIVGDIVRWWPLEEAVEKLRGILEEKERCIAETRRSGMLESEPPIR